MEKEHFGIFFSDDFQSTDVSWWYMQQKDHILCRDSSPKMKFLPLFTQSHDIPVHMQFLVTGNWKKNTMFIC